MAQEHVAAASSISVGAKIGGAPMVVGLVSLAHAMSHAYGALLPLILPPMQQELGLSYTQIGLMFTISNLVWGPLQLGFGILGRTYSRKLMLGIGHICQGLSVIGTGLTHSFSELMAWRITSRIADAPQHPIGNALISQSFAAERRGLGLAINAAGSNLGTVAVPLLGGLLIMSLGWRSTIAIFGLVGVLIGALIVGLLEDYRSQTKNAAGNTKVGPELLALLRQRNALLLLLSHILGAGGRGLSVATLYVPLYLSQSLQVDQIQLGWLLTLMMAGSVVGPLLSGPLSDRIGRKPVLLLDYAFSCVCFAGLLMVGASPWLLPAVLILTGIAVYSEGAVMQTALADIADKTSMDMLFGLYFTIGAAIGAPWSVLLGKLVDLYGFPAAFIAMGVSQVLAGLCVCFVQMRPIRATDPAH
ncbi:MAG: MFS transporter [Candidatus Tectomicrobia bacterium]|uniref:MFS transporter n=1 Tax=Tectimicrobiota bacterium TaxID=2528274 RepID=A0A937W0V8_UNCTE|nr:MFS transporter [Candidatus Tectomicrobia bacterium]